MCSIPPGAAPAEVLTHLPYTRQVLEPILISLAAKDAGKGRASIPHCSIACSLCFQHTHTHTLYKSKRPTPQKLFVRDGVQKKFFFLGLSYILKGLHTSRRTSDRPRSSDNDHKRMCRISRGSEPVGRDLCARKTPTPLPRLWLRSPAPGYPACKATRARSRNPAARRVPTPCPPIPALPSAEESGPGPVAGAHTGRPQPARRGPRASPPGPARPGPPPVQARERPRPGQARSGLPRPTPSGTAKGPRLTWKWAGGPGSAPGRAGGGDAALTAPLGLGSGGGGGGGGDGDGSGGSSSARTTRSGPRPGHAPPARAPIGQRPPRRAPHWSALLSRRTGAHGGGGTSVWRRLRRDRLQAETRVASDGRGGGRLGPGPRRPMDGGGRRAMPLVEGMLWVSRLSVPPPPRPPSPPCEVGTVSTPGLWGQNPGSNPGPDVSALRAVGHGLTSRCRASVSLSGVVRKWGLGRDQCTISVDY